MTVFFKPTEERSFFRKVQIAEDAYDGEDYQDTGADDYLTSSSNEQDSVKLQLYLNFSTDVSSVLSRGGYLISILPMAR